MRQRLLDRIMAAEDAVALRYYTQAKQSLAGALHGLQQFFHTQGSAAGEDRCQALLVKLAEDRFNLAVLGQFKRGKSSLMNAVIGRDLLPTGVLPLTSVVTTLCYGPAERLLITRRDWTLTQELPLTDLADYVTERGNPGNVKGVMTAQVEVPVPFLRRGLYFIDTPGVGSASAANTAATYAFLPEADAVIFVTSVDAPLNEAEETFLRDIRQHARKIFCVVNKIDLMNEADQAEVLGFVQTRLAQLLDATEVRLYAVSARNALQAKLDGDPAALERSGLPAFEAALADFLSGEKSRVFLLSIIDRALRLIADTRTAFALELRAADLSAEERAARLAELQQRLTRVGAALDDTLADLRAQLTLQADERLTRQMAGLLQQHRSALEARVDRLLDQAASADELDQRAIIRDLTGSVKAHQDQWLARQLAELQPRLSQIAQPILAKAVATLDQLPQIAAEVYEVASAGQLDASDPLEWPEMHAVGVKQIEYEFEPSLLTDFVPWRWARSVWRRQMNRALAQIVSEAGDTLQAAWRASIDVQVDAVTREVRHRFNVARGEIERRATLDLSGGGNAAHSLSLLADHFEQLRAALLNDRPLPTLAEVDVDQAAAVLAPAEQPNVPGRLPAAPALKMCPICAAQQEALFNYFAHAQYELATKEAARRAFASAGGFCAVHTWQFERIASPQGISIGYAPLIEAAAEQLHALADRSSPEAAQQIGALIQTTAHCPACRLLREVEQTEADKLLQRLSTAEGRAAYQQSAGVCLPHLQAVLARDGVADIGQLLITEQARRLEETAENMHSYTLKRDATRRWLQNRDERTAYWRALTQLIGERNVRALWPEEE